MIFGGWVGGGIIRVVPGIKFDVEASVLCCAASAREPIAETSAVLSLSEQLFQLGGVGDVPDT